MHLCRCLMLSFHSSLIHYASDAALLLVLVTEVFIQTTVMSCSP